MAAVGALLASLVALALSVWTLLRSLRGRRRGPFDELIAMMEHRERQQQRSAERAARDAGS